MDQGLASQYARNILRLRRRRRLSILRATGYRYDRKSTSSCSGLIFANFYEFLMNLMLLFRTGTNSSLTENQSLFSQLLITAANLITMEPQCMWTKTFSAVSRFFIQHRRAHGYIILAKITTIQRRVILVADAIPRHVVADHPQHKFRFIRFLHGKYIVKRCK